MLRPARDIVARTIAGERLLVPVRAGAAQMDFIFTLNEVGGAIFDLLDGRRGAAEIAEAVSVRYEVDSGTARADVEAFLADLLDAGLAVAAGAPAEA